MKKFLRIIALPVIVALAPHASAQLTAVQAFNDAPQSVFPLLDKNTRLDMLDYFKADLQHESVNALDGGSKITSLEPASLSIKMTDASNVQLFVVPAANDTIIGVITTVLTPVADSSMKLYTRQWKPLDMRKAFKVPVLDDWMADKSRSAEVEMAVPFMLVGYLFDPATSTLTLNNNLKGFLSADTYAKIAPLMRDSLSYRWDGSKFAPVK